VDWAERHAGLAGWVGAIGAIIAIFLTWALARAEYQRVKRSERERKDREIDLLKKITMKFDASRRKEASLLLMHFTCIT